MPSFKLRTKLMAGGLAIIFLFGLAIFIFVKLELTAKLETRLQHEGVYLAEHFATMCVDPLLTERSLDLRLMINDFIRHSDHLEYIFLVDPNNSLITHTFAKNFPTALKEANILKDDQQFNVQPIRLDQKNYIDVATPILQGQLGTFHLGVSEIYIQEIVRATTRPLLAIIVLFLCLATVTALFLARKITTPLGDLVDAATKIGRGDLQAKVVVSTDDELGLLGKTFNSMQENLLATMNSLQEHQENLEKNVLNRTIELQEKNNEIENNRVKLKNSLDEVSGLINMVIKEKKFGAYYTNPELQKCWEIENCDQKQCPCYGKEPMRCWHIGGSHCRNAVQGDFEAKYEDCKNCDFYEMAHTDPLTQIGEHFNDMMFVLEQKNIKLEDALQKLKESQVTILQQEKMASVGQLAAGVAHEINNPIGFITSNLGSLGKYFSRITDYLQAQTKALETQDQEQTQETLKKLRKKLKLDYILEDTQDLIAESQDGASRVKEIVQNLKSFSRLDEAVQKPADINKCIENTIKMVWNELKYHCQVVKEYGNLPLTVCNAQQLNQVFVNLLVNAAHAIEEKGVITIKTWAEKDSIFASISDTGQGIPEANLNKLFEPFFTTKKVGKGTGLGLSIAYDIVTEKHKGEINVTSEVGKGTTFTIKLPVVNPDQSNET